MNDAVAAALEVCKKADAALYVARVKLRAGGISATEFLAALDVCKAANDAFDVAHEAAANEPDEPAADTAENPQTEMFPSRS